MEQYYITPIVIIITLVLNLVKLKRYLQLDPGYLILDTNDFSWIEYRVSIYED